ncbi:Hsp20/alpha crystallin family protein [Bacillus sp. AG4(2022)]|uniref:Hsp20/alpha crystallin family protein n=1 Tax=Bacillus sp. AG4(2022) TaxID=2962594 RepID=UPI002881EF5D|nr:Hsp20/alpha crystallin family protein [Bacillus sp. AG4(2022)]MDT0163270.1 Hsp20/alpha crystallin family protein [Bacillus sp. AG4(2022)]
MNIDKMTKWLELTNKYQKNDFWQNIFDQEKPLAEAVDDDIETEQAFVPLHDIYQNESHICVLVEAPGVSKKDIKISLQSRSKLCLKGYIHPPYPSEMLLSKERHYGEFLREIPLPEPAEAKDIQVKFSDGLIYVFYPRVAESIVIYDESGH